MDFQLLLLFGLRCCTYKIFPHLHVEKKYSNTSYLFLFPSESEQWEHVITCSMRKLFQSFAGSMNLKWGDAMIFSCLAVFCDSKLL